MNKVVIHGTKAEVKFGRKVSVIMLSGGRNSTAVLYNALKNTDDIVLVHHVHFAAASKRQFAEAKYCKEIVKWCRENIRDFAYSETVIDFGGLEYSGNGVHAAAVESGLICGNFDLKFKRPVTFVRYGISMNAANEDLEKQCQEICNATCFPFAFPVVTFSNELEGLISNLPPDLAILTWVCEKPVIVSEDQFTPCGYCAGCRKTPPSGQTKPISTLSGVKNGKRPATLIMLSGGIDSVYQLYRFLKRDDKDVIALHINLINDDGRWQVEAERTAEIVKWCRTNIRDFLYTDVTFDRRGMHATGYDIMSVLFAAGTAIPYFQNQHDFDIEGTVIGWCEEETAPEGRQVHVVEFYETLCSPDVPPSRDLGEVIPKADQIKQMPPELVEMSWTCRRPIQEQGGKYLECGECHTCKLMQDVREQLAV